MRELIADLFITVDGYAAGRQAPAFFGYPGPELDGWIDEQLATPHTMVMGANTYRVLAGIIAPAADANSVRMTELPKLVFSSSLRPPLDWPNTTVLAEDVAVAVPKLKQQDGGPLRVIGSLSLVRSLIRLGLVDRLRLDRRCHRRLATRIPDPRRDDRRRAAVEHRAQTGRVVDRRSLLRAAGKHRQAVDLGRMGGIHGRRPAHAHVGGAGARRNAVAGEPAGLAKVRRSSASVTQRRIVDRQSGSARQQTPKAGGRPRGGAPMSAKTAPIRDDTDAQT